MTNKLLHLIEKAVENGLQFKFYNELTPKNRKLLFSSTIEIYNDYSEEKIIKEIESKLIHMGISPYQLLFNSVKNIVDELQKGSKL